jgi:alpha-1,3-rhamnosyltransferase
MKYKPLVTVIVPAYNHEKYIVECLDSIHNQSYGNFQWIVVDDGSRDKTPDILKRYREIYGYELIIQDNHGLSWTLTNIIKNYSKGEYISICASDDKWLPDKLKVQVDFMDRNPDFAMCYGKTKYMDLSSNVIRQDDGVVYKSGNIFEDIILQNFHPPVNYMYRKSALEEVGYFPMGVIAEDYYMNCKLSERFEIGYVDSFLTIYREAPLQSKRDPLVLMDSHKYTIERYINNPIYSKAISYHFLRCFNVLGGFNKYKFVALKCLFRVRFVDMWCNITLLCKGIYHFLFFWRPL